MEKKDKPRKEIIRKLFSSYFVPFLFNRVTEILVLGITVLFFI